MEKICPKCGAKSGSKRFVGFFCEDCFSERIDVRVEGPVCFEVCKRCRRMRCGKIWIVYSQGNVDAELKRHAKGKYENVRFIAPGECDGEGQAVFVVRAGDAFVEAVKPFICKRRDTICVDCSRASSGYFEAIVQVRSKDEGELKKVSGRIKRELSRKSFIAKTVDAKNGVDYYVGSNKACLAVLDRMRLPVEKTAKLYGVKDGQRVYRITYCVRC